MQGVWLVISTVFSDVVWMRYLVLVGGVEGDLDHFGVSSSHVADTPTAQLDAFEQRRL